MTLRCTFKADQHAVKYTRVLLANLELAASADTDEVRESFGEVESEGDCMSAPALQQRLTEMSYFFMSLARATADNSPDRYDQWLPGVKFLP